MSAATRLSALLALLLCGAIFGFYYAWVCSTMWGLDMAAPQVAVAAMQAMNASVRNAVFAPSFFGTPVVLLLTATLAWRDNRRPAAKGFALAAAIVAFGGVLLTMRFNVPMNEALALEAPQTPEAAEAIWQAYSPRWQMFNQIRAALMGLALLITGWSLMALSRAPR